MKKKIFIQVGDSGYSFIKKQKDFFLKEHEIIFYNLLDKRLRKKKRIN